MVFYLGQDSGGRAVGVRESSQTPWRATGTFPWLSNRPDCAVNTGLIQENQGMDNSLLCLSSTQQAGSTVSHMKYFILAYANNQEVSQQKAASLLHLIGNHLNNSAI